MISFKQLYELSNGGNHEITHEKSPFGGYRAHIRNTKHKSPTYLGQTTWKTPEAAKGEAEAYHKAYFRSGEMANERSAHKAVKNYITQNRSAVHPKN